MTILNRLTFTILTLLMLASCGVLGNQESESEKATVSQDEEAQPAEDTPGSEEGSGRGEDNPETTNTTQSQASSGGSGEFKSLDPLAPEPINEPISGNGEPCKSPDPALTSPKTIEQAILLINSLPKPASVLCFIQALQKPLKIAGTYSNQSAQPATDSPRFFIFQDDL